MPSLSQLYATTRTAAYLNAQGVVTHPVGWPVADNSHDIPIATRLIQDRTMDLVINLPNHNTRFVHDNYLIRRTAIDSRVPLLTNFEVCVILWSECGAVHWLHSHIAQVSLPIRVIKN